MTEAKTFTNVFWLTAILAALFWVPGLTKANASDAETGGRTDLGKEGNREVARVFERYRKAAGGCIAQSRGKRILVGGFNRFRGADQNISGLVVASMADRRFFPSEFNFTDPFSAKAAPSLPLTKNGAWTQTRELRIGGNWYQVCFVVTDVRWDLAAAILIYEIERFQPSAVILSGRGGDDAIFEGGARNRAGGLSGFDSQGKSLGDTNRPWCLDKFCAPKLQTYVLPPKNPGVKESIDFTWDNKTLAKSTGSWIRQLVPNAKVRAPAGSRPENDYICNNVSFVTASALSGVEVVLAGDNIRLSTSVKNIDMGFFHYPKQSSLTSRSVWGWSRVLARTITLLRESE